MRKANETTALTLGDLYRYNFLEIAKKAVKKFIAREIGEDPYNILAERLIYNIDKHRKDEFLSLPAKSHYEDFKAFINKHFRKCENCESYEPNEFFYNPNKDRFQVMSEHYCYECNNVALKECYDLERTTPIYHSQGYMEDKEAIKILMEECGYSEADAKEKLFLN